MRRRSLALAPTAALLAGALLAACSPALPPDAAIPKAYLDVIRTGAEAQSMYRSGRWADAAKLYREQADAAAGDPNLAGWRDQALYNLACVLARDGKTTAAADAFALSIAEGLRPVLAPTTGGAWAVGSPPVSLPHLLADPDLDAIRDEPAYREAIRGYLATGEAHVEAVGGPAAGPVPAVVALVRPGARAAPEGTAPPPLVPAAPEWLSALGSRPAVVAALAPPIRPHPRSDVLQSVTKDGTTLFAPPLRAWRLPDGDDRWAVGKVRETLDLLAADPRVDPARVWIAAPEGDSEAAVAAWAAALAMPDRVAGLAVPGGTFRRIAWADLLAAVPGRREGKPAWRVVLAGSDVAAEAALADAGIEVRKAAEGSLVAEAAAELVR